MGYTHFPIRLMAGLKGQQAVFITLMCLPWGSTNRNHYTNEFGLRGKHSASEYAGYGSSLS